MFYVIMKFKNYILCHKIIYNSNYDFPIFDEVYM